jgi:hypothetical protein
MFAGMDAKTWLGLSVIGAVIAAVGALIGIILKDFVLSRSFETWKQGRALEQIYQKYRDPLLLAGRELQSRVCEIISDYPTVFLATTVYASKPEKQLANSADDEYYKRYKLISTLYRLSAFLGWLELYRQEITFLHSGKNEHAAALAAAVDNIRIDLADGNINDAEDWDRMRDTLVFREELRAIGESLIETRGGTRAVMGYGRYVELLESPTPSPAQRWSLVVANFFLDLQSFDFRQARLKRLFVHTVQLTRLLDGKSVEDHLRDVFDNAIGELDGGKLGLLR